MLPGLLCLYRKACVFIEKLYRSVFIEKLVSLSKSFIGLSLSKSLCDVRVAIIGHQIAKKHYGAFVLVCCSSEHTPLVQVMSVYVSVCGSWKCALPS